MLQLPDFNKKQIVFLITSDGEKISFKNDNLIVKNKDETIKYQCPCYKVFAVFVIGEISITSGLIKRANKYAFCIFLMSVYFRINSVISFQQEGNTLLHRKQYDYKDISISKFIIKNKIENQLLLLKTLRNPCEDLLLAKHKMQNFIEEVPLLEDQKTLRSIEGNAAKIYFKNYFNNMEWKGRKPRIKCDFMNAALDIGYSLLFNYIECMLRLYGFDLYCGVLHTEFYMRKSLVCDLMEPFRCIIDKAFRNGISHRQIAEDDFTVYNHRYLLKPGNIQRYSQLFLKEILKYKDDIFLFIQSYYRNFMKNSEIKNYKEFYINDNN